MTYSYNYNYNYNYNYASAAGHGTGAFQKYPGEPVVKDLAKPNVRWPRLEGRRFTERDWDPMFFAIAIAADFVGSGALRKIGLRRWNPRATQEEIEEMLARNSQRNLRHKRMGEILEQHGNAMDYWQSMFGFGPMSHPATFQILCAAIKVGESVAMHFKARYNRPRPSQVSPDIQPPTDYPGHASYPSGHATQSHLIARCLADVMPPGMREPLRLLAVRISENREVAGFHYVSDSRAGKFCAEKAHPLLKRRGIYKRVMDEATKEWRGAATRPRRQA